MARYHVILLLVLLTLAYVTPQFFVRLDDKDKKGAAVAKEGEGVDGDREDIETRWKNFVRWFRENGGIISSKLTVKERNGRQGVYFKERMRRGETIVSFPRTLRMDEKSAFKSKQGDMWRTLKEKEVYPDLRMVLYVAHEYKDPNCFWRPYMDILPRKQNNIMYLTDAEMRKMLRRPGCENTHNFGVGMRRTFSKFYNQYKTIVEPLFPNELGFTRDELVHAYNLLLTAGWGTGDGTGDKYLVPFSDTPVHRRESAQKANNRGFISAAKMYEAGEELTFDYGLVNPEVLAFFGTPTPDCRGLKR
eukprot:CAMPEP_0114555954 /NCGR_PEP_ID=MMETSP0114-20121206/9022_1 /TAXON_ID=31324 /ORGANISM="Goniomonas sp, Strain m" /LENGTH=303 /DNA_ID=CAMNT_0001741109 /DNA_START=13 /DNA_END=924 /DNA_ORIENTATION=-